MAISFNAEGNMQVGSVNVVTTSHTGLTKEHWAERLLERIVFVADETNPVIKDQAIAYKDAIRQAIIYYMAQAIKSDRTTMYNMLLRQGETEMAELIRRL